MSQLTVAQIEDKLEDQLDAVLSSRRTAEPLAQALALLRREQQDFVLHWVSVIVKTNSEMGYQFAAYAADALRVMDLDGVEDWLIHAMDVYDKQGLYPACSVLKQYAQFADQMAVRDATVTFEQVAGVLQHFVAGLSGRPLKLAVDDVVWTDTETLYLPQQLALLPSREKNFRLYKAMASYLWAQLAFGTFRAAGGRPINPARACAGCADPEKALETFQRLEAVRLNACIERELPGLYREMNGLQNESGAVCYAGSSTDALNRLRAAAATVMDTCDVLREVYPDDPVSHSFCYQGQMQPERTEAAMLARMEQEKLSLRNALNDYSRELQEPPGGSVQETDGRFEARARADPSSGATEVVLEFDGKPVTPPDQISRLLQSVLQDLGEIPDDYLVPAGADEYRPDSKKPAEDVWEGARHEDGAYLYNEWDYRRQHYRKDWCVLREIDVHPKEGTFIEDTLDRYAGLVAELRRTFEILRGQDRLLKKQKYGDDIDLDAVVEAFADARAGREMTDRLLTKLHKTERDMAVVFMVDMSGSTKGWINEAERESLVLLCEALEILGDRYAIYGFSGLTRKRCELYRVKAFGDPYDDMVRRRIIGIKPQDYTRMGVVIRHLTSLFRQVEARIKLLVTLSDGKPDDYDGYRGEYGIEDTRQALIEAKHEGIHPFCITIDTEAKDYLPHMYGAVNYVLVDKVHKLPFMISDIYRQLTT